MLHNPGDAQALTDALRLLVSSGVADQVESALRDIAGIETEIARLQRQAKGIKAALARQITAGFPAGRPLVPVS